MAVRGASNKEIANVLHEYVTDIQKEPEDWEYIGIPGGIGQPLDEYDTDTAQVSGAKNANKHLGLNIGVGDKPYRCYLSDNKIEEENGFSRIDVICYEKNREVENESFSVDVARMQDVTVRSPMEKIMDAIEIDVDAAIKGQAQSGLKAFM